MDEKELAEIEDRYYDTTSGPWRAAVVRVGDYQRKWIYREKSPDPEIGDEDESVGDAWTIEDAEFMAHARQDVPALVAEVRRLRAALDVISNTEAAPQDIRNLRHQFGFVIQTAQDTLRGYP